VARSKPFNPFYALLVMLGIVFLLTACAYCVMAFKAVSPQTGGESASARGMLEFLQAYGGWALAGEVVALAIATIAAMATDSYWTRRAERLPKQGD